MEAASHNYQPLIQGLSFQKTDLKYHQTYEAVKWSIQEGCLWIIWRNKLLGKQQPCSLKFIGFHWLPRYLFLACCEKRHNNFRQKNILHDFSHWTQKTFRGKTLKKKHVTSLWSSLGSLLEPSHCTDLRSKRIHQWINLLPTTAHWTGTLHRPQLLVTNANFRLRMVPKNTWCENAMLCHDFFSSAQGWKQLRMEICHHRTFVQKDGESKCEISFGLSRFPVVVANEDL